MTSKLEEQSKFNGRWTKEEHERFILGLQLYGKDWKKIQALIGTRNGAQIRSHAQKYFIKVKKEGESLQHVENWEQTKQSGPEYLSQMNLIPHPSSDLQTRPDFSYYLNKIVQQDALNQSFDFWGRLIDHKSLSQNQPREEQKRKSSFVSIAGLEKDELDGRLPCKKVKCE